MDLWYWNRPLSQLCPNHCRCHFLSCLFVSCRKSRLWCKWRSLSYFLWRYCRRCSLTRNARVCGALPWWQQPITPFWTWKMALIANLTLFHYNEEIDWTVTYQTRRKKNIECQIPSVLQCVVASQWAQCCKPSYRWKVDKIWTSDLEFSTNWNLDAFEPNRSPLTCFLHDIILMDGARRVMIWA